MAEVRLDERLPWALTWTRAETLERSSHALVAGGRVWLVDPVADDHALLAAERLGRITAVLQAPRPPSARLRAARRALRGPARATPRAPSERSLRGASHRMVAGVARGGTVVVRARGARRARGGGDDVVLRGPAGDWARTRSCVCDRRARSAASSRATSSRVTGRRCTTGPQTHWARRSLAAGATRRARRSRGYGRSRRGGLAGPPARSGPPASGTPWRPPRSTSPRRPRRRRPR